jgi:flagellar biosynthesis protein FlhF
VSVLPSNSSASCYRFVVDSADEAARLIREKLGAEARVLSVRAVGETGWRGWLGKSRLEVVAQVPAPAPDASADEPRDLASTRPADAAPASDPEPFDRRNGLSHAGSRVQPAQLRLPELLRRSGFSDVLMNRLAATPAWNGLEERPLHQSLVHVADELRRQAAARPSSSLPDRTAFFGPAGVGRTTALCKWLGTDVFRRGRSGRVVQVEFDRPNPAEQLAVFCEALGLSCERYPVSLAPTDPGFIYLDLPALSLRDPADNAALAGFFAREGIEGRVLVLNAAYDSATLRAAYTAGRGLGATHLVFTHLDELTHWGKLWDYLIDTSLQPLFLATGPSLTGDCEEDVHGALLRRTLPGA